MQLKNLYKTQSCVKLFSGSRLEGAWHNRSTSSPLEGGMKGEYVSTRMYIIGMRAEAHFRAFGRQPDAAVGGLGLGRGFLDEGGRDEYDEWAEELEFYAHHAVGRGNAR